MDAVATSYGPPWGGIQGGGTTATGIDLHSSPHKLIVAVDPGTIPLGSKLKIWPNPFNDPNLIFTAADTGGAIKGNRIDFYDWRGRAKQNAWGVQHVKVQIVGKGSSTTAANLAGGRGGGATTSTGGGPLDWLTDEVRKTALRGLLYTGLVFGGAVVVGVGIYRLAEATPGGEQMIDQTKRKAGKAALAAAV